MPKIQMDTRDQQVGQNTSFELPETGEPDRAVVSVDGPDAMDFAAMEAFMNEKVEIIVAESVDPNAENPIPVNVNGSNQFFFRGSMQVVKRKFVEVLARAKHTDIRTQVIHDPTSDPRNIIHQRSALKYPFQVVRDDNPRGARWLKQILAEA